MKTIVILAHPNIEQSLVSKSWINALKENHAEVKIHNIYEAYPDWKIDVEAEQKLVSAYDRIIFQFPVQWLNMTPLMKKWFDDVLSYGWAYGPKGDKLVGKEIGAAVSAGSPEEAYQLGGKNLFPLSQLLSPIEATVNFVNAKYHSFHAFYGVFSDDLENRLKVNTQEYLKYVTQ